MTRTQLVFHCSQLNKVVLRNNKTKKGYLILTKFEYVSKLLIENKNTTQVWCTMGFKNIIIAVLITASIFAMVTDVCGKRGRGRSRSKSRVQIGLPITGKYRDPESDQYYNHNDGAKIVMASHFDYEYVLGHKIVFVCVARGNPRPQITWYKDGTELYYHYNHHVHEWNIAEDSIKSKLEIDPGTQMDAGVYECSADNKYSIDRRSFKTDFSIAFES